MRRIFQLAVCVLVLSFVAVSAEGAATPATMGDIAGSYNVALKSSISVARAGKAKTQTTGVCTVTPVDEVNGKYSLNEDVGGYSWLHTGDLQLVPGGKKVDFQMDAAGKAELDAVLKTWATNLAAAGGSTLTSIVFDPISTKYTHVPIKAKTIQKTPVKIQTFMPKKAKVTIKGVVTVTGFDDVGPFTESLKFTYMTDITFVEKLP